MTLKSLAEHNRQQHQLREQRSRPHPNGIACPKCGAELWDSAPMIVLTSNPPQKSVHCRECGYRGTRLA